MSKPKNADIGTCPCSVKGCGETAGIRRTSGKGVNTRLYLVCPVDGVLNATGKNFQAYIAENGTFAEGEAPPPAAEPAPERRPELPARPAEKVSGGDWWDAPW